MTAGAYLPRRCPVLPPGMEFIMLKLRRARPDPSPARPRLPAVPSGRRCYAIGDVHGRLDLLVPALDAIRADLAGEPVERAFVVFLGDLIDRGPSSRQVIEHLRGASWGALTPVFLAGNHEEAMLASYDGDLAMLRSWVGFGGADTAESYGVPPVLLLRDDWQGYWQALRAAVPAEHVAFVRGFYDQFALGDYLFVHAGVRPGVSLEEQSPRDLRWIRDEFLLCREPHGKIVVHGHTIADAPELLSNRIGIDTGAYRTGILTVLRLQGTEQRVMAIGATPERSSLAQGRSID